jgi:hypothetical protein
MKSRERLFLLKIDGYRDVMKIKSTEEISSGEVILKLMKLLFGDEESGFYSVLVSPIRYSF